MHFFLDRESIICLAVKFSLFATILLKIAHIINPAVAPEASDLSVAQPVTFKTMVIARDFAKGSCDVELFATCFPDEHIVIPDDFHKTSKLTRSVQDFDHFKNKRKLPPDCRHS